jgi:NAD(P)-dependent dehydrogenase (short-subunit alcohol dehydrogenase family)
LGQDHGGQPAGTIPVGPDTVVPGMIAQQAGQDHQCLITGWRRRLEAHGAYAASKGGLNMLTKVMTVEWAKHNIQINSVCPTVILTPMGEQVWGDPVEGRSDEGQNSCSPLRPSGRGG